MWKVFIGLLLAGFLSEAAELQFNLKLTNVDSTSAELEILDDNKTTINYHIKYKVTSHSIINNNNGVPEKTISIVTENELKRQTNSLTLLTEQEAHVSDDESTDLLKQSMSKDDQGELYTSDDIEHIKGAHYEMLHRFIVLDLEPNREYDLTLNIKAREAFLSSIITGKTRSENPKEFEKLFNFKFKTMFDYDLAASLACKNSMPDGGNRRDNRVDNPLYITSSCYVEGTNCTKCRQNCYEVKQYRNQPDAIKSPLDPIKPILCEACPCDTSRSTGECVVASSLDSSETGGRRVAPLIKCKQCIEPYVGATCNECHNEGVDFYKSSSGECLKCSCNNNAALDVNPNSSNRRKCQAITGICLDCMFNTTGNNCDQCLPGFVGDAVKRTCVQQKTVGKNSSNSENQRPTTYITDPNKKYSYKTLALFSLYIFCVLSLVLLIFLCIKARYYDRDMKLKNGVNSSKSSSSPSASNLMAHINSAFDSLGQSTKSFRSRVSLYFGSICPTTMRFVRVASNQPTNGYYVNGSSNDDDRLNLAEYQMFDDSLLNINGDNGAFTYRANFNDLDDGNSRNPYRSLTMKT